MNVELFSCSGGMAEGFRRAGVRFDLVVDWDTDACASYEKNLDHRPVRMDVRDVVRMARLGFRPAGSLDLLVADPPCTPWSRAGKRKGIADGRDCLVDTVELIRLWRPRAYLLGNVPGLQDAPSWGVVQRVIGGLVREGYCVRDYYQLDAADYGVPQHRIRPFWFGHLDGPCLVAPAPTHGEPTTIASLPGIAALTPHVTCRQALCHLPPKELGRVTRLRLRPVDGKNGGDESRLSSPNKPARTIVCNPNRKGGAIVVIDNGDSRADEPAHTITATKRGNQKMVLGHRRRDNHPISSPESPSRVIKTNGGRASQGGSTLAWPWDRPSTTIQGDERLSDAGYHDHRKPNAQHASAIVLSERAAAILQGFPETWLFSGATKRARWAQIGMAMPPPLAEAIARSIVAARSSTTAPVDRELPPDAAPEPAPPALKRRAAPQQTPLPL